MGLKSCAFQNSKSKFQQARGPRQKGQVVIEYVLLLVVGMGIVAILLSQLVKRDASNPGMLVAKWQALLQVIGNDVPDKTAN